MKLGRCILETLKRRTRGVYSASGNILEIFASGDIDINALRNGTFWTHLLKKLTPFF